MRRATALLLLPVVAVLAGCSGFGVGVRQDKEDRDALGAVLATKRPGDRFPARELLAGGWTRLYVFAPGVDTQPIEDRIGIPFPYSAESARTDAEYLVFTDEEEVRSSFTFEAGVGVGARCLRAGRGPLGPDTELTLVRTGAGQAQLSTVAEAARCG